MAPALRPSVEAGTPAVSGRDRIGRGRCGPQAMPRTVWCLPPGRPPGCARGRKRGYRGAFGTGCVTGGGARLFAPPCPRNRLTPVTVLPGGESVRPQRRL